MHIGFDSEQKEFVRDDGTRLGIGRRFDAVVVPNDLFCDLDLESLNDAVGSALSEGNDPRHGLWWPSNHDGDHEEKYPRGVRSDVHFRFFGDGTAEVVVETDKDRWGDEFEWIRGLVAPAVARFGADWVGFDADPNGVIDDEWVVVRTRLALAGRTASGLLHFGESLHQLVNAAEGGELSLASASDLARAGFLEVLVGLREGSWFDAKGEPYRLDGVAGKLELAKDVASFANAQGGLILAGARTARDRNGEAVTQLGRMPLRLVDVTRVRDTLAARVFPSIEGLDIRAVSAPDDDERGVMMIHVPPQQRGRQPFMVRGVEDAGRYTAVYLAVPTRRGDSTEWSDVATIHGLLVTGRLAFDSLNGVKHP